MNSQKGLTPLLIILLIALAVGGYLLYQNQTKPVSISQPSPTPTTRPVVSNPVETANPDSIGAGWKTYQNTKVGFVLKYPSRYPQPGLPSGRVDNSLVSASGKEDNTEIIFGETSTDAIGLVVFPFSGTMDKLRNYAESIKSPVIFPSYKEATLVKNIRVGGVSARWYKNTYDDPNDGMIKVYFIGKNHGFILHTSLNHNEKEIDQILSTFKFLNSTPDQGNPSWKQYQVFGLNKQQLSISYELPEDVKEPLCVNSGCSYRATNLPGGSTIAIIPVGQDQGWLLSWDKLVNTFIKKTRLSQEPTSISGKEGLKFEGSFDGKTYPQDLNLLDEGLGEYKGVLVQIDPKLSLEVILYQSPFTKGKIDFVADLNLFEQILNSIKINLL